MNTVNLGRTLVLETRVRTADGLGGYAEAWVARGTLWAEVLPGSGGMLDREELTGSVVPMRITVRGALVGAPSRPVAGDRFREGVRTYGIVAVIERDPGGRYLTCFAQEEVPA